jgi:hypothetical protein
MTKAKIRLCKFFEFCIYSRHNWQTTDLDNWQINVHRTLFLYWKALPLFQTYENCWALKWQKLKLTLQILWVLHFIATIDKQQDLGDNWQINVHKNFICTENSCHYFPDLWKHCWALRMTKAKIRLCKFFEFCIL